MALSPAEIEALVVHGYHLHKAGKRADAETYYRAALTHDAGQPDALHLLGLAAYEAGDMLAAVRLISQAIDRAPNDSQMACDLGLSYQALGQWEQAILAFLNALALDPLNAALHQNLANCHVMDGQSGRSLGSYVAALSLAPELAESWSNLGSALHKLGRPAHAAIVFRRALRLRPDYLMAASNLIFASARNEQIDGVRLRAIAEEFDHCISDGVHEAAAHLDFQAPGRILNIGYMSGDFCTHPVAEFMMPLFQTHDRARVKLYLYSTGSIEDEVTSLMKKTADHWCSLIGLDDRDAAARIRADRIDVLVDLSGHTASNRLGIFAHRAAPVQCHYVGFPATTGLRAMDYWIGDETLTPPSLDPDFTERVWRLDRCFMAYAPRPESPDLEPSSDRRGNGMIRFGSFNALTKIGEQTMDLWAKLLHRAPRSTLLLKARELEMPEIRQNIRMAFLRRGIAHDRLDLRDHRHSPKWRDHMMAYADIDIALDPIGAQGGVTTTCEALWMGIPVICFMGKRVANRMAATLLKAAGFDDWISESEEDYIAKAIKLALASPSRSSVRKQMAASPLCDVRQLTAALEDSYQAMTRQRSTPFSQARF